MCRLLACTLACYTDCTAVADIGVVVCGVYVVVVVIACAFVCVVA